MGRWVLLKREGRSGLSFVFLATNLKIAVAVRTTNSL